jgi:urease subunit alpha
MMGDGNASIPTPQPVIARPMFASFGRATAACAVHFGSAAGIAAGAFDGLRRAVAVHRCRAIGKRDLVMNDTTPRIEVNPDTYEVRADGVVLTSAPAEVLPLAQRYFLF